MMKSRGARAGRAIDTTTPILIFGLARGRYHHGALGIARSAGRLGIPVYRLSKERRAPAATSRYSRGWSTLPNNATEGEVLEALNELGNRIGRAILVPIDDAGAVFVEEHGDALAEVFLFPRQRDGLAAALSSKREMYELCMRHDIPTPTSLFPESEEEALEHAESIGFPAVLKCINAADSPRGAPRVLVAADREELLDGFQRMRSPHVHNVMIQLYIPGTPESVWMFNGYFDSQSECKLGFTGKKMRQSPPFTGITTLGECVANPTVKQTTIRFMKALGYRGILDIGYRFDERDGLYKLLDVNPRIGGTFRLFVGEDGADVLRASYLDLTGQEIPESATTAGRRWLVEPQDLASSLTYLRRGDISLLSWARSFGGVREAAWLAGDDPLPFLALGAFLLADRIPRRVTRRESGA